MATRRRSYRGTEDEHRIRAKRELQELQASARNFRISLRAGDCASMFTDLSNAMLYEGRYAAHRSELDNKPSSRRGSSDTVRRMEDTFFKKCVRK
jgi:hypothetical protein